MAALRRQRVSYATQSAVVPLLLVVDCPITEESGTE